VDLLADMAEDELATAWRLGRFDLPRLWRWFEAAQIEILVDDPACAGPFAAYPFARRRGELRPLAHLYLPGDFNDPLGLATLVDLAALDGRAQFYAI
jgi:hypothetical protein